MYKCKHCGKEFENRYQLTGHSTNCKMNPNYERNKIQSTKNVNSGRKRLGTNKYIKDLTEYHCQYCNKVCIGKISLTQHEIRCKNNPNRVELSPICKKGNIAWNKGLSSSSDDRVKQQAITLKKSYDDGKIICYNKGRKCSEEQKHKTRISTLKYLESLKGPIKPRYSKKGCQYIDNLNEEKGWNLQHAENGGEIQKLGYFFDGYDEERNIVFEYDEIKHYQDVYNNILTEKDIERQEYIIKHLKCKFYRYNEVLDLFYEVK